MTKDNQLIIEVNKIRGLKHRRKFGMKRRKNQGVGRKNSEIEDKNIG